MPSPRWRLIPLMTAAAGFHMATDWYLATRVFHTPLLRFYRWEPPALSLGFHQPKDKVNWEACRRAGIDVVRRPTGGRAVLHFRELTYAVIIPKDAALAGGGIHAIHNRISLALARGIRSLGIDITLQEQSTDFRRHYHRSPRGLACFTAAAKYELQIQGKKVVGSAQRLFPQAVLQHGSILLGAEHRHIADLLRLTGAERRQLAFSLPQSTTELETVAGKDLTPEALTQAIGEAWQEQFQCTLESEPLCREETHTIRSHINKFMLTAHHAQISNHY